MKGNLESGRFVVGALLLAASCAAWGCGISRAVAVRHYGLEIEACRRSGLSAEQCRSKWGCRPKWNEATCGRAMHRKGAEALDRQVDDTLKEFGEI